MRSTSKQDLGFYFNQEVRPSAGILVIKPSTEKQMDESTVKHLPICMNESVDDIHDNDHYMHSISCFYLDFFL